MRDCVLIGTLAFLACCFSRTEIVPSKPTRIEVSRNSDTERPVRLVRDAQDIDYFVRSINASTAETRKFHAKLKVELIYDSGSLTILINGHCFVKEGLSYCSDIDLERAALGTRLEE